MDVASLLSPVLRSQLDRVARQAGGHLRAQREALEADTTLADRVVLFRHTTQTDLRTLAAVSAHGVFPVLRAGGASAVFTVAASASFQPGTDGRPHELAPASGPVLDVAWLADEDPESTLDAVLERLAGRPLLDVVHASDYRQLKRGRATPVTLMGGLLRPGADDVANVAIQLQHTAELGATLALIEAAEPGDWVLAGHTMTLPYVRRPDVSLFQEHLLRLCAVTGRVRGVGFATLSDASGLPLVDTAARHAARLLGHPDRPAEHWALRVPDRPPGGAGPSFPSPPEGAVTYVGRFHSRGPAFRLDLDRDAWALAVRPEEAGAADRERALFEQLDYFAHDLRAYGTPYPVYAARARAHVSEAERSALRDRLRDAASRYGPVRTAARPTP